MSTLHEQLGEIEKERLKEEKAFPRMKRLESVLDDIGVMAGFSAFFSIISLTYIIFWVIFPNSNVGDLFFLLLYAGLFAVAFLKSIFEGLFENIAHWFFKINKENYQKKISNRKSLYEKKKTILKELERIREQDLLYSLNDLVYNLENKKISIEVALATKMILEEESNIIHRIGYQIYTKVYYTNRFKKVEEAIKSYEEKVISTLSPIPSIITTVKSTFPANPGVKTHINPTAKTEVLNKNEEIRKSIVPNAIIKEIIKPIITGEDKSISELFDSRITTPETTHSKQERSPIKIDYLKLNNARQNTGLLGELYALEWEKRRLEKSGLKMYIDKVVHISKTDDSAGYDIISFCDDGSQKYIEVKTTTDTYNCPFYLTETEILTMKKLHNYFIYRVYSFNVETGTGSIFIINCGKDIEKYYKVQPVSYRVSPK